MSATRENRLWGWLKKVKPIYKEQLHMVRVENAVGSGMPDVDGAREQKGLMPSIDFKIELKCAARPVDTTTKIKVKFQRSQPEWHRKRSKLRCRIFILLQVGQAAKASRYLVASSPSRIHKMQSGVTETELEAWSLVTPVCTASEVIEAVTDPDYIA